MGRPGLAAGRLIDPLSSLADAPGSLITSPAGSNALQTRLGRNKMGTICPVRTLDLMVAGRELNNTRKAC
jgi:hypothetical protein